MILENYIIKGCSLAVLGVMAEGIAANQLGTVALLGAGVASVIGAITWLKNQIKEQIADHAKEDAQRHSLVLEKIEHLKELMETKLAP